LKDFTLPMKIREKVAGWIYLPIHTVLMSLIILPAIAYVLEQNGNTLDTVELNTIYYVIGFAYVLIFMMPYLRENFIMKKKAPMLATVFIGYFAVRIMSVVVNVIVLVLTSQVTNPNSEAVSEAVAMSIPTMVAVACIMGPIVEEVLFRGVLFGSIRTKNRIWAYIVSVVVFAVYHLWGSVLTTGDWSVLIFMIQYVPHGIMLAWAYERTGSLWTSIFLHMLINTVSVLGTVSML